MLTEVDHDTCPGCGHHTSAWVGGSCTVFVRHDDDGVRYCDHDCSVDLYGESWHDRFVRLMWGGKNSSE